MRKTIALFLGLALSIGAMAQKADIISAVLSFNKQDIAKAKEFIDKASPDAALGEKNLSKYWYYRGSIYYAIATSQDEAIASLEPNPVAIAVESFKKELEVDVKERYSKKDVRQKLWSCSILYTNKAYDIIEANPDLTKMSESDAKSCLTHLETAIALREEPVIGVIDSASIYTASIIAQYANDMDRAVANAQRVLDLGYKGEAGYANLVKVYTNSGQDDKALEVIQKAKAAYPKSLNILISEVDIYIAKGEIEKAIDPLKAAVEANPKSGLFVSTLGTIYSNVGNSVEAQNCYTKAVELDPSLASAWYGLGAIEIEKANALVEKMNAKGISDSKFKALKAEQQGNYETAMPLFEKVVELEPENTDALDALKKIYYQLDMAKEMMEVKRKLDAIRGK